LHIHLALFFQQGEDQADRGFGCRHPNVMVIRVHARIGFVDNLALVGNQHPLHPVIGMDHIFVEAHLPFFGGKPDLSNFGLVKGHLQRLSPASLGRRRGGQKLRQVQVVVQGVVAAHLIVEVVEIFPGFVDKLKREARFGSTDWQGGFGTGNVQKLG
jgi:hypothetical protein